MPWYLGNNLGFRPMGWGNAWLWGIPGVFILLVFWGLIWTGLALWHAAQRREKWWFLFFLLVHTAGIVEILYLVFVVKIFTHEVTPARKKRRS